MEWSRRAHLQPGAPGDAPAPPSGAAGATAEPVVAETGLPAAVTAPDGGPADREDVSWAVDDAVPGEYDRTLREEEQVRS
jgi:hypothetical protein